MRILMYLILAFASQNLCAQVVSGEIKDHSGEPLVGANVYWLKYQKVTASDENGHFSIPFEGEDALIVSFIGFKADTIPLEQPRNIIVNLISSVELESFEVKSRTSSTEISMLKPLQVQTLNEKELGKAACCNLSESFETNASVDAHFTDAISGYRHISLLGLKGKYVLFSRELIPTFQGINNITGLTYTPGSWLSSIQISKGVGSVVSGYQGITGQINFELKKPSLKDRFYLNMYGNQGGRLELNSDLSYKLSDKVQAMVLLHASTRTIENDRNQDGFLDNPLTKQYNFINRYHFLETNGWMGQAGLHVI
ncbi:MAG: carboxypeptidase-like regulatory domain-containing protein, partial [Flavobacteriales bacterium]|nr:carboxypeptidase-like regulatory domain-containing protein [Flavobacteriales bacterium]